MPNPFLLLTGVSTFMNSVVLHRNTSKVTETQSILAKKQGETQREIANMQVTNQLAIAEAQQLTQLKLAYLNIQHQTALEQDRQNFQIDMENGRQKFQERMEMLRIGSQVSLEQARQIFESKRQQLSQEHQAQLTQFVQSVNLAIHKENLDFQQWRLQQEQSLQEKLASYNRETQIIIANIHRETALMSPIVNKVLDNWPLSLVPAQILGSDSNKKIFPLRIFISPPVVDYDRFGERVKGFPPIEKRLAEGLGKFLSSYYPLNSNIRPTELLDGAWDSNRFRGGASIKALFEMLKSEPTLILESQVDGPYLNFRIAYWGLGQEIYCYERIISKLPYRDILYESAKSRAKKWQQTREELLKAGLGKDLTEIDQNYGGNDNPENLKNLEKENVLKARGINQSDIPIHYQINQDDWDQLCEILSSCHCLITAWIADAHYLINYDVDPLLPDVLFSLLKEGTLPIKGVIQAVVDGYKDLFTAIAIEQPHRIPNLALKLAEGLVNLPDKSFANELFDYSIQARINLG